MSIKKCALKGNLCARRIHTAPLIDKSWFIARFQPSDMCYFLVSVQESNQRKRPGDALTAKPFVTAVVNQLFLPGFEPPSPGPHPAPVEGPEEIDFLIDACVRIIVLQFRLRKIRPLPFFRPAPGEVHRGGWLKVGVKR